MMLLAIGAVVLAALLAPTVLAALALHRAGAVLGETRRIHQQLANIIQAAQRRALARRNDALRQSSRESLTPLPPPLPAGPKLELNLEDDWEDGDVVTDLPGAPTDWGYRPSPRQRR